MNPDFSDDMDLFQLERELQSLTPAPPRRELVQAIKARMEPVPRQEVKRREKVTTFPWRRMVAPAAAAAAAVAVFNLDDNRREGKNTARTTNDVAPPAINWEPMPMLPEYRAKFKQGFVLTQDMEAFVDPRFAEFYGIPVFQPPTDMAMRFSLPQQNHFILPAGYGSGQVNMFRE